MNLIDRYQLYVFYRSLICENHCQSVNTNRYSGTWRKTVFQRFNKTIVFRMIDFFDIFSLSYLIFEALLVVLPTDKFCVTIAKFYALDIKLKPLGGFTIFI